MHDPTIYKIWPPFVTTRCHSRLTQQYSKREIVGSSPAKGKIFSFCNFRFLCVAQSWNQQILIKQNRSTEGCSKLKSPETRQVKERYFSTLEHMQVPKLDMTRCPDE